MKFKFRYIIIAALTLTIGIFLLAFFVGGLIPSVLDKDNIPFNEDKFIVDMEYLQKYDRKISFGSSFSEEDINDLVDKLKENKYLAEITDFYGEKAIYIGLGVGDSNEAKDKELKDEEMFFAKLVISREFDKNDFKFTSTETEIKDFEIEFLSVKAKEKIENIRVNLISQGYTVTVDGDIISLKYSDNLVKTKLTELTKRQMNQIAIDGEDADPVLVAAVEAAIDQAKTILSNKAESIARSELLTGITFESSIFETSKIVAQNDKFTMYFDESTTHVMVGLNESAVLRVDIDDNPILDNQGNKIYDDYKVVYRLSEYYNETNELVNGDSIVVYSYGSDGKVQTSGLGTFSNSVQYYDLIQKKNTRHYSINYDVENGLQVLYDIGNFTNINSFFPRQIDREAIEDVVRGNFWLIQEGDTTANTDEFGRYQMTYNGRGITTSKEAAEYIEEHELATVIEKKSPDTGESYGYWELADAVWTEADLNSGKITDPNLVGEPKAVLGVHYNTAVAGESPLTSNPFLSNREFNIIFSSNTFELENNSDKGFTNNNNLHYTSASPLNYISNFAFTSSILKNAVYDYLYDISDSNYYRFGLTLANKNDPSNIIYRGDDPVIRGGVHARDEEGNFLYDELGNPVRAQFSTPYINSDSTEETRNIVDEQNIKYGNDAASANRVFRVGINYQLNDDGIEFTIMNDAIIEGRTAIERGDKYAHDAKIARMNVLPYFTSNYSATSIGEMIIPDGSGGVISFNSIMDEQNVVSYQSKPIYGADMNYVPREQPASVEKIMMGMFGYLDKTSNIGVLAIADKGASQTDIVSDFKRAASTKSSNYIYFIARLRESENVFAGVGYYESSFVKWTDFRFLSDFKYVYNFVVPEIDSTRNIESDNFNYVEIAKMYREYLINKYNYVDKDKTTDNVVNLNFLGAFEKKALKMGIVYDKDYSLTTFMQAKTILEELSENGITEFSVAYTSWTSDKMENEAVKDVKVAKILGGSKGLNDLMGYLDENLIALYPTVNVAKHKGYDYAFGNQKYTTRSVSNTQALHYPYVIPTKMQNKRKTPNYYLSPSYYESYSENYLNSFQKLSNNVYLSDLGNEKVGDYSKKSKIFAYDGELLQKRSLQLFNDNLDNVMLNSPFDYAVFYADNIVSVPLSSTTYPIFDNSIPLYQLVFSGLVDYSIPPANYMSEHDDYVWYILKALETGSNLNFVLSYEDTNILLETDYTEYSTAYYINWKNKIIEMNNKINETGIHGGRLINHEYVVDNVVLVTYDNGVRIMINYSDSIYQDVLTGMAVKPNDYVVLEGGI
ncbi:MAG: DUF5696 domain-containing protein [Bacilli bacterium]|nr:DUF5696 domain-containing protein [Bacilli bacterium]